MVLDRKIAFVNLSDASYEIKSIPLDWRRKFLGGRGINMHLLSKPYSSILDPFSQDNPLIFGAGLLAGILGLGSRMNITSRSPESGHLGDSNMGGELGAEMVKAGLSHIVVTGKSRKPVYLFISEDKIEFCDARKLKGLYTVETQKRIRFERRDRRVQIARSGCHLCERLSDFLRSRQGVIDVA